MSANDLDFGGPEFSPRAQLFRRFSHLLSTLPIVEKKKDLDDWYQHARLLSDEEFRPVWDTLPHEFHHFMADADIRLKDASYGQHQEETILRNVLEIIQTEIQAGVIKNEPNQPLQRNASTGSAPSLESPARHG